MITLTNGFMPAAVDRAFCLFGFDGQGRPALYPAGSTPDGGGGGGGGEIGPNLSLAGNLVVGGFGQFSGPVSVGAATAPGHAVTKSQLETAIAGVGGGGGGGGLPLSGGTLTGPLTLSTSGSPATGTLRFGNAGKGLVFDGTKFDLTGGELWIDGAQVLTAGATLNLTAYAKLTGAVFNGPLGTTSTFEASTSILTNVANVVTAVNCASMVATGSAGAKVTVANGAVSATGQLGGNLVTSTGNITAGGSITATGGISTGGGVTANSGTVFALSANFNSGAIIISGNNVSASGQIGAGLLTSSGGITATGTVTAGGVAVGASGISSTGSIGSSGVMSASSYMSSAAPSGSGSGRSMVNSDNRFGVASWNNTGYFQLVVDGTTFGWTPNASDIRLKEDIAPAEGDALARIRQLDFIDYRFRKLANTPDDFQMPLNRTGISAQQAQQIEPSWVQQADDGPGTLMLNLQNLLTNALRAIQQLEDRLTAAEEMLNAGP